MASNWNGLALQTAYTKKSGFNDTASTTRMLVWINDIQNDIQSYCSWPFLKMKIKKQIISGDQEIDISPQVPTAPTLALLAGGSLTTDVAVYAKVTFVIFDESGKEINTLESEPSVASNTVTPTGSNLSLTLTNIDLFDGSITVKPIVIRRRIYLKSGTGAYFLAKTIEDNTTVTATITVNTSSVVEPPEYSLVSLLAGEDPLIEGSGTSLRQNSMDAFLKYDPNFTSAGIPTEYARVSTDKIFLYPKPSSTYTLSYWVYKIPSRIFADTDRVLQIHHGLKEALDAGITWKFYEYNDMDGQESKKMNYEAQKEKARGIIGRVGGQAGTVKVVC